MNAFSFIIFSIVLLSLMFMLTVKLGNETL